jgi:hypothetical protein
MKKFRQILETKKNDYDFRQSLENVLQYMIDMEFEHFEDHVCDEYENSDEPDGPDPDLFYEELESINDHDFDKYLELFNKYNLILDIFIWMFYVYMIK